MGARARYRLVIRSKSSTGRARSVGGIGRSIAGETRNVCSCRVITFNPFATVPSKMKMFSVHEILQVLLISKSYM